MPPVRIGPLVPDDPEGVAGASRVLHAAFLDSSYSWQTLEAAREEVLESLGPGRISLVARDEAGEVVGWAGGIREYARVWELHPLAVTPSMQRRGVGRALVAALEERVAAEGALVLHLGTDDERGPAFPEGRTSLFGVDLYPDPLKHLLTIRNLRGHPYEFYLRCGFSVAGVVPDASGIGEPDILMAKRVASG